MIHILYGTDRQRISTEVKRILGQQYEIFNGENLSADDLPGLFLGRTIFADKRKILLKDVTPGRGESSLLSNTLGERDFYELINQYVDTPHDIVIWESYVSQKKSFKDFLKNQQVQSAKYETRPTINFGKVMSIYNTALTDGRRALKILNEVRDEEDPYMFVGLLATQAIKSYEIKQGRKEKRVLCELSKLDIAMKSTTYDPWLLISSFLLQVSSW